MEPTNGDMAVAGERLLQRPDVVVVPSDQGLKGLQQSTSSSSTSSTDDGEKTNFGKSIYYDEDTDPADEWPLSKRKNGAAESDVKQKIADTNQDVSRDNDISPEKSPQNGNKPEVPVANGKTDHVKLDNNEILPEKTLEKETKSEIPLAKGKKKHVKLENLIEESDEDEDIIELEFERAITKLDTHTMHCPNCNACITKVILRKKRTKPGQSAAHDNTQQPEAVDVLGCSSCFSVFVPSGNCFSWIRLLANGGGYGAENFQETNVSAPGSTVDNGNMVIDKEGDCFSLFRIFSNKPEKKITQKPPQQTPSETAYTDRDTINKPGYGHAQKVEGNLVAGLNLDVDENVVSPVLNGGASHNQNAVVQNGGVSNNQNEVLGASSSNNQDANYSALRKPLLSTPAEDWAINFGEISTVSQGNDTAPGDEPGASYGTGNKHQTHISSNSAGTRDSKSVEIVKSIVYGGLMESITSLSIVASAAAAEATTLNIVTIGLANLIGGLIIIGHNLRDLKNEGGSNKYQEQLGQKENFVLHATFAVLSFLVFGLIPPATYGYAIDKMNDKNLTLVAIAVASLLCVIILAAGKAYARNSDKFYMYIKTILYYVCITVMVSGVSYEAGDLINKLMESFGWFEPTPAMPLSLPGVKSRYPMTWTY